MYPVALQIALANTGESVSKEEVFRFIDSSEGDFETYRLAPPSPGQMMASGVDYGIIIATGAFVIQAADFLWRIYDRFIASKKANETSGLIIILRKDNGSSDLFWLGHQDKDREVFIREFTEKIQTASTTEEEGRQTLSTVREMQCREIWIRHK